MDDHRLRDSLTRASLLIQIRDPGNRSAWQEFDEIYRPMLKRVALARGLDAADADDITQQCMVAVHNHIKSFEYDPAKGRFKSWIRTLANNRIRNLRRVRRPYQPDDEDFDRTEGREQAPDAVFDRIWLETHLQFCFRKIESELGRPDFLAFKNYVIDEQPVTEVCRELGLTPGRLYKIEWRVTRRMRQIMEEHLGSAELLDE